ncbi:invasion associated locus B family protein [Jannaschia donghaensis]|uniref:Invasion protein B, involved in pathogenesis n=1 Tax=Jannaschia donghaensis TaxID=420998 RepID=A0A0M6YJN6_9RHOB|nr:invasion associated locus B family protein [Jannaschia donghaensis]CTQ50571.1 Invasion protein B, involved in pathogenesis [Jannaschia donghaensis]
MTLSPLRSGTALAIVLSLGAALSAAAQDAATPEAAPADTTETAPAQTPDATTTPAPTPVPAAPGGDLATGTNIGEALGGGPQIYVREEHGDWEVRCLEAPEGQEDPCQLYQRLADQQGNPTADVNFFDLPDGGDIVAGATILTPLQTLLTAQVTMTIDGGQPRRYPYSFCDATGCYSRMGFSAADVAAFRAGNTATLVVVPALAPDQRAELTMSLSGFTAGLAAVEVDNAE